MKSLLRVVRVFVLVSAVAETTGCAVPIYERAKLAHPTMDPTDAASPAREHVYAVHEGAMGGHVGAASGCGCN